MFYIASIVGLGLVFVPGVGAEINGARAWVDLGGLSLQPAEFAKLAVIVTMALVVAEKAEGRRTVSDRPEDPRGYSVTSWAEQVVALLDHLGAAPPPRHDRAAWSPPEESPLSSPPHAWATKSAARFVRRSGRSRHSRMLDAGS